MGKLTKNCGLDGRMVKIAPQKFWFLELIFFEKKIHRHVPISLTSFSGIFEVTDIIRKGGLYCPTKFLQVVKKCPTWSELPHIYFPNVLILIFHKQALKFVFIFQLTIDLILTFFPMIPQSITLSIKWSLNSEVIKLTWCFFL